MSHLLYVVHKNLNGIYKCYLGEKCENGQKILVLLIRYKDVVYIYYLIVLILWYQNIQSVKTQI